MVKRNEIEIYCKCYNCLEYFEVTNKRISKFCSDKCKQKNYRNEKDNRNTIAANIA